MPVPVSVTDSLRTRAAVGVESQPVHVPHDPAAGGRALGVDRVEPVDGQLAQALQVRAFAAEPLEQERGVRDGELVPAVRTRVVAVKGVGALSGHLCHPAT